MNSTIIKNRTKGLALSVIRFAGHLESSPLNSILQKQIIRSATSVGANYRAACRAKSKADFIHKLKIVEEELDETMYWLELIGESDGALQKVSFPIYKEANELISIIVSSIKTLKTSLNTKS